MNPLETNKELLNTSTQPPIVLSRKEKNLNDAGITPKLVYSTLYKHITAVKDPSDDYRIVDGVKVVLNTPDYKVQSEALDKVLKITGDIKPESGGGGVSVTIGATPSEVASLLAMALDVKEQLAALRGSGRQTGEIIDITPTSSH